MNDSKIYEVVEGFVAELDGRYWGVVYEDRSCKSMGWVTLDKAYISQPFSGFCSRATDLTYEGSPDLEKLSKARMVPIKITKTYSVQL